MKTRNILILAICFLLIASFAVSQTRYPHGVTGGGTNTFEDVVVTGTTTFEGGVTLAGLFTANGGILIPDDIDLSFGDASDVTLAYDEASTDRLILTTAAAGGLNILTGNMFIGPGVPVAALDGLDLYVSDTSEFTGHVYAKSNVYLVDDAILAFGAPHDGYVWYDETTDDLLKLTIASATGGLMLETGNLFLGAGTPGQTIDGNDLYVTGLIEADDIIYADRGAAIPDDYAIVFGTDSDASIEYDEDGTNQMRFAGAAIFEDAVEFDTVVNLDAGAAIPDDTLLTFGDGPDASIEYDEDGTNQLRIAGVVIFEHDVEFDTVVSLDAGAAIPDDITLILGTGSDITLEYDEDGTDQGRFSGALIFEDAIEFDGALDVDAAMTLESTAMAADTNEINLIKTNYFAGQTFTGTQTPLAIKAYDADNTVVHSGDEFTGLSVWVKQHAAMAAGGKSSLATFHWHGDSTVPTDFGLRIFGDQNDSTIQMAAGSSTDGLDMSLRTFTGSDIVLSNGETIDNVTNGVIAFSSGIATAGYTSDPCGTLGPRAKFYNTTSDYECYCNNSSVDLKSIDGSTACF